MQPDHVILLETHSNEFVRADTSEKDLKKELTLKQKSIRRLEESIKQKRHELTEMSMILSKELQNIKLSKDKQSNFLEVLRATDSNPKLRQKHEIIVKVQHEIDHAKRKLLETKINRESGITQKGQNLAGILALKEEEIRRLKDERKTVRSQVKSTGNFQDNHADAYFKDLHVESEIIRKDIKKNEKEINELDREEHFYDEYSSFLYGDMASIEREAQRKLQKLPKNNLKQQIQQIRQIKAEKIAFQRQIMTQLQPKIKRIKQLEEINEELQKKIRQIQINIKKSELDLRASLNKSRSAIHSSQNINKPLKKILQEKPKRQLSLMHIRKPLPEISSKIELKFGNMEDSPSWLADKSIINESYVRVTSILIYLTEDNKLAGILQHYLIKDEQHIGMKMVSQTNSSLTPAEFEISELSSIAINFNQNNVFVITVTKNSGESSAFGTLPSGQYQTRTISLSEYVLISAEVKLANEEEVNETLISGLKITLDKKKHKKNAQEIEEDIRIENEEKQRWKSNSTSRKNIVYRGQLPKIQISKKAIDHRLGIFENQRR